MNFSRILRLFLIWQVLILVFTAIAFHTLPLRVLYIGGADQTSFTNPQPYIRNPLLYSRANFDGIHYTDIARRGYGLFQEAFFPLYPSLIKWLSVYIKPPALAGIAISSVSFIVGLWFFVKLIGLDYRGRIVLFTVAALLAFPAGFYFTFVYTEGLFFLLVISSFYCARRGLWGRAAILGSLASYTRLNGIILFPALLIEWWFQHQNPDPGHTRPHWRHLLVLGLIPLGLLYYMLFLHQTTGDPLAFIHVQQLFGQGRSDKIILLYQVFWRYIKMVWTVNRADPLYFTIWLEFVTGTIFSVISVINFFRFRYSYAFFSLATFLLPSLTGTFTSQLRYVLLCFPAFILIGIWLSNASKISRVVYFGISIILQIICLMLFVRGYWIA